MGQEEPLTLPLVFAETIQISSGVKEEPVQASPVPRTERMKPAMKPVPEQGAEVAEGGAHQEQEGGRRVEAGGEVHDQQGEERRGDQLLRPRRDEGEQAVLGRGRGDVDARGDGERPPDDRAPGRREHAGGHRVRPVLHHLRRPHATECQVEYALHDSAQAKRADRGIMPCLGRHARGHAVHLAHDLVVEDGHRDVGGGDGKVGHSARDAEGGLHDEQAEHVHRRDHAHLEVGTHAHERRVRVRLCEVHHCDRQSCAAGVCPRGVRPVRGPRVLPPRQMDRW